MPATAFFSFDAADRRTLSVLLEYVQKPTNVVLDAQKHTITMHPAERRATITSTSRSGVTTSKEVVLLPDTIILVDSLPHVFENTVRPMYAITADRVAVLMNPFTAGIKASERPLIRFEGGMFEDVFGGRIRIEPRTDDREMGGDGRSGVCVLEEALSTLFEKGMDVKWGEQPILRPQKG